MADAGGSDEAGPSSGVGAVFFKRRPARGNLRKRDDGDDAPCGDGDGGGAVRSSARPRPAAALGGTTAREAAFAPVVHEADRSAAPRAPRDNRATAATETETEHSRDGRAAREAVLARGAAAAAGGGSAPVDDGLYHGAAGYIDHRAGFRREHTVGAEKGSGTHGPLRAPTNVRRTYVMDYKPDVCKDYKETGYCGYGDSCKFAHDRGDYKHGWQLDKEWDEKQRERQAKEKAAVAGLLGEEGEEKVEEEVDPLPFACFVCRRPWAEAATPMVTRCGHYACEDCALSRNAETKTCATCNVRGRCGCVFLLSHVLKRLTRASLFQQPTGGVFNVAHDIQRRMREAGGGAGAERAAARREARAAAARDEVARGGKAGWALG